MTIPSPAPAIPLPSISRVAIIGAGGPSGINALTQLLDKGVKPSQIRAFEARESAGGVWHYDEDPGIASASWRSGGGVVLRNKEELEDPGRNGPTAVYPGLRTNLQHEVMAFRDQSFPEETAIYPTHREIVRYLQSTVENRGLKDFISFSTVVRAVYFTPGATDPTERWTVETSTRSTTGIEQHTKETFSHIIVSNGHYNEPFIPSVPGLSSWKGQILHSRWWRHPSRYRDKNILVIGGRASGSDISRELAIDDEEQSASSRTIYQSIRENKGKNRGPNEFWDESKAWSKRINVLPEVKEVREDEVEFIDGTIVRDLDVLLFATGYLYSYPFFPSDKAPFDKYPVTRSLSPAESALPQAGGHTIENLNLTDTFYAPEATLAFVGLHYLNSPFPLSEVVSRLIAHSFSKGEIPPLKPLKRNTDRPDDRELGVPGEYVLQDDFLEAIGEGGEDGGQNGGWKRYPDRLREARANSLVLRKEILGY